MMIKRKIAAMSLAAAAAVACGNSESGSTPEGTDGDEVNTVAGTLSLNLLPSLNDAAGTTGAALLLAPSGDAPSFAKLQEDYVTPEAKDALFGSGQPAEFACQAVNKTARSISKFLSMDSNLCMFKEIGVGQKAGKSWLTVDSGTIGEEGIFGQKETDKKVKIAVPMGEDGTMNAYFDIKGSGGDAKAGYELKMRMCYNDELASVQLITIDRATGKVSITQNDRSEKFSQGNEAAKKEDKFVGYLNKGGGWDLAIDREFSYDMYGDNQYQALVAKFTKEGQIVTTDTHISSGGDDSGTNISYSASTIKGTNAVNLALSENYTKRNDQGTVTTGGMEFVDTRYESAEPAAVLKAIVDALPNTGRYVERPASYTLPLLEGEDCTMASPDVVATFDMQTADPEIDAVCDTILTDSPEEVDATGNPFVRDGSYCNSLGQN